MEKCTQTMTKEVMEKRIKSLFGTNVKYTDASFVNIETETFENYNLNKGKIVYSNNLYTAGMPDPDLMIRTSGEIRTSNFLPWQLVYSEFYFIDKLWPDFNSKDLDKAIEEYNRRNRKFGAS